MIEFEGVGEIVHVIGLGFLVTNLIRRKTCGSLSLRSQLVFIVVYIVRIINYDSHCIENTRDGYNTATLVHSTHSTYPSFDRWCLLLHIIVVLLMFSACKNTYRHTDDSILTEVLVLPSLLVAVQMNGHCYNANFFWYFSIVLEPLAILPQFYIIFKQKNVEKSLLYYLIPLAVYKPLFVLDWFTGDDFDLKTDGVVIAHILVYGCAAVYFFFSKTKVVDDGNFFGNEDSLLKIIKKLVKPVANKEKKLVENESALPEKNLESGQI